MDPIYLDNNATTPVFPEVREVIDRAWRDAFANPGSQHGFGREARKLLEESRETIAGILNAAPEELVFTSGGSESLNTAVSGLMEGRGGVIGCLPGEHPATSQAIDRLTERGIRKVLLPVDRNGRIDDEKLAKLPWDQMELVCLILAHNETGVVQDPSVLSDYCDRHRVPLVLDVVQAVGKIPFDFHRLPVAAAAFGAHKFHGPRGIGGLLLGRGVRIPPLLVGGHQEGGRRAGTEAVPLIAGMAAALKIWHDERQERQTRMAALRDQLEYGLSSECGPTVVHGCESHRLPNTLSIAFPGLDGEALLVNLGLEGVACSLGSTCASGSAEVAPILTAMGVSESVGRATIRLSIGALTTEEEIAEAIRRIRRVIGGMRSAEPGISEEPDMA